MELRHLRYFVAVAEELHFGRAAARLHLSQPPLSQQIRTLEEELGLKLFSRDRRRVELTHAGNVFLAEARKILSQMEHAAGAARRAERGQIGPLVVACGPLAVQTVLPMILKTFRMKYPEVDLNLRESSGHDILDILQDKKADVGLLMPHFSSERLQRQACLTLPLVAALPKDHALAGRRRIRLKDLVDEPFVLFSAQRALGFYEHIVGICERGGFTPKVVQEAGQHPTLLALVAAGYGVTIIPALSTSSPVEEVAFVRIVEPWATMPLWIAWRASDSSPVLTAFLEVVRSCCRRIGVRRSPSANKKRRRG
jgi:DNA-binding transcriptional LysR family regulator